MLTSSSRMRCSPARRCLRNFAVSRPEVNRSIRCSVLKYLRKALIVVPEPRLTAAIPVVAHSCTRPALAAAQSLATVVLPVPAPPSSAVKGCALRAAIGSISGVVTVSVIREHFPLGRHVIEPVVLHHFLVRAGAEDVHRHRALEILLLDVGVARVAPLEDAAIAVAAAEVVSHHSLPVSTEPPTPPPP